MDTIIFPLLLSGALTAQMIPGAYMDAGVGVRNSRFDTPHSEYMRDTLGVVSIGYRSRRSHFSLSYDHVSGATVHDGYGINFVSIKYHME